MRPSLLGRQQRSFLHTLTSRIRPGTIYYHPHPSPQEPQRYAVSFLSDPSTYADSATNLGFIPLVNTAPLSARAVSAPSESFPSSEQEQSLLRKFEQNPEWMKFVHFVLQQTVFQSHWLQQIAQARKNTSDSDQGGYVHIIDQRNIPPANRVGDPDDIIASVLVKNGALVPDTYEPGQTYRVYTSSNGFMTLPPELHDILLQSLKLARQIEQGNST